MIELDGKTFVNIRNEIFIHKENEEHLVMEWTSSKFNDIIGDCIGYMLYNVADYEDIDVFGPENSIKN